VARRVCLPDWRLSQRQEVLTPRATAGDLARPILMRADSRSSRGPVVEEISIQASVARSR
jgi:hypothetical protein